MLRSIFTNWLTSILGTVAGVPQIIAGITSKPINWQLVITGIGTFVMGLAAKDANVTGGTVKQ
jgi:hypothetical protein